MRHILFSACVIIACCNACSPARHIYFGKEGSENFNSSDVTVTRKDRLAYVAFFDYKTTRHAAGKMAARSSLRSLGIFSPYSTKRAYEWAGNFVFASGTDSCVTKYVSFAGEVYKGDYGAISVGRALGAKRQPTTESALMVRGTIYQAGDPATFEFFNEDETAFEFLSGYLLHNTDSLVFKDIDSAVTSGNTVINKRYGYGLFLNEKMLAAIDFKTSPKKVYVSKDVEGKLKNMVFAYLAIAAGNFKIVTRNSTFLKTFW